MADLQNEKRTDVVDIESYVTKEHLNMRLSEISDKIDTVDRTHERNFSNLDKTLSVMSVTFKNLDSSMSRMVENQEETNKELKQISMTSLSHETRIKRTEERQDVFELSKKEHFTETMKVVGLAVTGMFGLAGTIITVAMQLIK